MLTKGKKAIPKAWIALLPDRCQNCGTTENLQYHHIVPVCVGGNDVVTNICVLCSYCHKALHYGGNIPEYRNRIGVSAMGGRHKAEHYDGYLTTQESADYLGVSNRAIQEKAVSGRIPFYLLGTGRDKYFKVSELDYYRDHKWDKRIDYRDEVKE